MESKRNNSSDKEEKDNPYLSTNVKDILKRRREEKGKKNVKKMNLISLTNEGSINETENDNENEEEKMIDKNENNKNMKELEKKAKQSYKGIGSKHNNLDINFDTKINKSLDGNKNKKKSLLKICCKELFFLIINIISYIFFYFSFLKKSDDDIIYYYFLYPINKMSLIFLLINAAIMSLIIILVKINQISILHLLISLIFYAVMYFKYHLTNNAESSINYFDPANCHFFIFFIILIHVLGIMFILYYIAYYFYLSGQYSKNEKNLYGLLVDYWESEKKIARLEKYININLDQLITSKGYSHEENIINKKRNSRVILRIIYIGFFLALIHVLLMIKKNDVFNCDYLTQGLIYHDENINKIDDNKFCKISKPKGLGYMNALTGFFDKFTNLNNCSSNNNYEKKRENLINDLIKKYNNKKILEFTNLFGYPLTNNKDFYNEFEYNDNEKNFQKFEEKIYQEIFDFSIYSNKKPESFLDFSDEKNPKLTINVQFNEELSNERKLNENNDSLFKNVFVVYLSGVSQFYFKNVLPKLSSFIKKFSNEGSDINNNLTMNSYQFTRYHSFSNDSFSNYFLMFYDSSINSIQDIKEKVKQSGNNDINTHLKYFKENGYITGQSVDICNSTELQFNNKNIFWDHENLAISCDLNYLNNIKNNNYCLYGNPFYSYHINYALQFWEKYKNNKKYFRLNFNSVDEKTGSLLSYLDQPLYDLFIKLHFNGLLDDTAIFFISEYGGIQDNILYNLGTYNEKDINMKLGSFFLLVNKKSQLSENEYKNIYNNQNKIISPFDICATLFHIPIGNKNNKIKLYLDENNKGESIFNPIDGNVRNSEFYKDYWINEKYCTCVQQE